MKIYYCLTALGLIFAGYSPASAAEPVSLPPIEFLDASGCNANNQFHLVCGLFPGTFSAWNQETKGKVEKAFQQMKGPKLEHLLTLIRAGGLKKISLVVQTAAPLMAGTMVDGDTAYIEVADDFFNTPLSFSGVSEQAHALTHELMHVYLHYYVGNKFFSAPFWDGLPQALEWNYAAGLNGLVNSKERNLHFDRRNHYKHEGKLDLAVAEDLNYARGLGFPSLYSMSQLEEYLAELGSFLIHDPSMQAALPVPVATWLAKTDLGFLLDLPLAEPMPARLKDRRVDINGKYDFVGMLFLDDMPVCTVTLLSHGFIVLARHCFDQAWFLNKPKNTKYTFLNVQFRPANGGPVVRIDGSSFDDLGGFKGVSDLAYIRFPGELTSSRIKLPVFDFITDKNSLTAKQNLFTVGYPMPGKVQRLQRFISAPCDFDGRQGEQPGLGQIYQGPLWGTTCPAWFGSSGSPIFSNGDLPGHLTMWGVLSHTFSSDLSGNPLPGSIKSDAWGSYTDSNFSPLFLGMNFPDQLRLAK